MFGVQCGVSTMPNRLNANPFPRAPPRRNASKGRRRCHPGAKAASQRRRGPRGSWNQQPTLAECCAVQLRFLRCSKEWRQVLEKTTLHEAATKSKGKHLRPFPFIDVSSSGHRQAEVANAFIHSTQMFPHGGFLCCNWECLGTNRNKYAHLALPSLSWCHHKILCSFVHLFGHSWSLDTA